MSRSSSIDKLLICNDNVSDVSSIRGCFNAMKANILEKPCDNFYNIESNKKLEYLLRHAYTFKHHERKHFDNKKCEAEYKKTGKEFLNATMQNKNMREILQPRGEPKSSRQLNMSASTQSLYADLFTGRYKKLTQNLVNSLQESNEDADSSAALEKKATAELHTAKKNRIYKELGLNLNLKEIFGGLGYSELMKLKKLHVLYATQRIKAKLPRVLDKVVDK